MIEAEEILIKHCPSFDALFTDQTTRDFKARVLKAMIEYADYVIQQEEYERSWGGNHHDEGERESGWSV